MSEELSINLLNMSLELAQKVAISTSDPKVSERMEKLYTIIAEKLETIVGEL